MDAAPSSTRLWGGTFSPSPLDTRGSGVCGGALATAGVSLGVALARGELGGGGGRVGERSDGRVEERGAFGKRVAKV